jgi:hypothetical protein
MTALTYSAALPVLDQADVCIVGGGLSGVSAALATVVAGKDTVLVEERGALAWEISHGLDIFLSGSELPQTFANFVKELTKKNAARSTTLDTTALEVMLDEIMVSAGVRVHFRAFCGAADPIAGSARVTTKSGPAAITARAFIDATEQSRVARSLGATFRSSDDAAVGMATRAFLLASVEPPTSRTKVRVAGLKEVLVSPTLWPNEAIVSITYRAGPGEHAEGESRFLMARTIQALRQTLPGFEEANLSFSAHESFFLTSDIIDPASLPANVFVAGPARIGCKPTLEERVAMGEEAAALAVAALS